MAGERAPAPAATVSQVLDKHVTAIISLAGLLYILRCLPPLVAPGTLPGVLATFASGFACAILLLAAALVGGLFFLTKQLGDEDRDAATAADEASAAAVAAAGARAAHGSLATEQVEELLASAASAAAAGGGGSGSASPSLIEIMPPEAQHPPHSFAWTGGYSGYVWTVPSSKFDTSDVAPYWPPPTHGPKRCATKWLAAVSRGQLLLVEADPPAPAAAAAAKPPQQQATAAAGAAPQQGQQQGAAGVAAGGVGGAASRPRTVRIDLRGCSVRIVTEGLKGRTIWMRKAPLEVSSLAPSTHTATATTATTTATAATTTIASTATTTTAATTTTITTAAGGETPDGAAPVAAATAPRKLLHGEHTFFLFSTDGAAKEQWYGALCAAARTDEEGGVKASLHASVQELYARFYSVLRLRHPGVYPQAGDPLPIGGVPPGRASSDSAGAGQLQAAQQRKWGFKGSMFRRSSSSRQATGRGSRSRPSSDGPPPTVNPDELDRLWYTAAPGQQRALTQPESSSGGPEPPDASKATIAVRRDSDAHAAAAAALGGSRSLPGTPPPGRAGAAAATAVPGRPLALADRSDSGGGAGSPCGGGGVFSSSPDALALAPINVSSRPSPPAFGSATSGDGSWSEPLDTTNSSSNAALALPPPAPPGARRRPPQFDHHHASPPPPASAHDLATVATAAAGAAVVALEEQRHHAPGTYTLSVPAASASPRALQSASLDELQFGSGSLGAVPSTAEGVMPGVMPPHGGGASSPSPGGTSPGLPGTPTAPGGEATAAAAVVAAAAVGGGPGGGQHHAAAPGTASAGGGAAHEATGGATLDFGINLLLARMSFDTLRNPETKAIMVQRFQRKLGLMKVPDYISQLQVVDVCMGTQPPRVANCRAAPSPDAVLWPQGYFDFAYDGDLALTIEAKVDFREGAAWSQFERTMSQLEGAGAGGAGGAAAGSPEDMDSDEEDALVDAPPPGQGPAAAPSSSSAPDPLGAAAAAVSVATTSPPPGKQQQQGGSGGGVRGGRFMNLVSAHMSMRKVAAATIRTLADRTADQISRIPLRLKVSIVRVQGPIHIWVAPPPSNRLWYAFVSPPELDIRAVPELGNRILRHTASATRVSALLERKLRHAFLKNLVFPMCSDLKVPLMMGHDHSCCGNQFDAPLTLATEAPPLQEQPAAPQQVHHAASAPAIYGTPSPVIQGTPSSVIQGTQAPPAAAAAGSSPAPPRRVSSITPVASAAATVPAATPVLAAAAAAAGTAADAARRAGSGAGGGAGSPAGTRGGSPGLSPVGGGRGQQQQQQPAGEGPSTQQGMAASTLQQGKGRAAEKQAAAAQQEEGGRGNGDEDGSVRGSPVSVTMVNPLALEEEQEAAMVGEDEAAGVVTAFFPAPLLGGGAAAACGEEEEGEASSPEVARSLSLKGSANGFGMSPRAMSCNASPTGSTSADCPDADRSGGGGGGSGTFGGWEQLEQRGASARSTPEGGGGGGGSSNALGGGPSLPPFARRSAEGGPGRDSGSPGEGVGVGSSAGSSPLLGFEALRQSLSLQRASSDGSLHSRSSSADLGGSGGTRGGRGLAPLFDGAAALQRSAGGSMPLPRPGSAGSVASSGGSRHAKHLSADMGGSGRLSSLPMGGGGRHERTMSADSTYYDEGREDDGPPLGRGEEDEGGDMLAAEPSGGSASSASSQRRAWLHQRMAATQAGSQKLASHVSSLIQKNPQLSQMNERARVLTGSLIKGLGTAGAGMRRVVSEKRPSDGREEGSKAEHGD